MIEKLSLVVCRNKHIHGENTLAVIHMFYCGHLYEYPPQPFVDSVLQGFVERNPDDVIGIAHGECPNCKGVPYGN